MIWTIGHSNQSIDRFIGLLSLYGISDVYDVRSRPYSRFNPQFGREKLAAALDKAGIGYVYMGDVLGGHPLDPTCYVDGRLSYALQAKTTPFQAGLDRLRADSKTRDLAIMCAEKDPQNCHRCHSISKNLPDMEVRHILNNGQMMYHCELVHAQDHPSAQMALAFA